MKSGCFDSRYSTTDVGIEKIPMRMTTRLKKPSVFQRNHLQLGAADFFPQHIEAGIGHNMVDGGPEHQCWGRDAGEQADGVGEKL